MFQAEVGRNLNVSRMAISRQWKQFQISCIVVRRSGQEPDVRLLREALGQEFVLMDDNTRPNIPNLIEDILDEEGIYRMEWPTKSSGLNPIKHVWDISGKAIA
ncbi:transposable element Tcb2 transposase [Trichonephila clavipes]|nr:transposable element Tcb2 transposase [Trichonephila clavipes]